MARNRVVSHNVVYLTVTSTVDINGRQIFGNGLAKGITTALQPRPLWAALKFEMI